MQNNKNKNTINPQIVTAHNYQISISGPIGEPEDYIDELNIIRNANENDSIELFINTPGGNVNTGVQLMTAIRHSPATVIGHLESECHSAGTYVALSCDDLVVYPTAFMLIHTYTGGAYGKGNDAKEQVLNTEKWIHRSMREIYQDFLTEEEFEKVCNKDDMYLHPDDIVERWKLVLEARKERAEEQQKLLEEQVKDQARSL